MVSDTRPRVELSAAVLTDVGMVRDHNEDSAYVDPDGQFFIVADGMGGHAAGEVASAMAVEKVQLNLERKRKIINQYVADPSEEGRKKLVTLLDDAVRGAHRAVFERGIRETDKHGMGTTLDVVIVAGPEAFVAHVGDSRTYLIRDSRAAQITTDHTVAEVLVIEGKLSLEEAQISPLRTILVNAIGVAQDVGIEMAHVQLRKGDHLLMCSDGLHDYFPVEQELADYVTKLDPRAAIGELVEQAKERGGHDNITGIIVEIEDCESTKMIGEFKTPEQILAEDITATLPLDSVSDEVAGLARGGRYSSSDAGSNSDNDSDPDPDNDPDNDDDSDDYDSMTVGRAATEDADIMHQREADAMVEEDTGESDAVTPISPSTLADAAEQDDSGLDFSTNFDEPTLEHARPDELARETVKAAPARPGDKSADTNSADND